MPRGDGHRRDSGQAARPGASLVIRTVVRLGPLNCMLSLEPGSPGFLQFSWPLRGLDKGESEYPHTHTGQPIAIQPPASRPTRCGGGKEAQVLF